MNKHTVTDLIQMQSLPLELKIKMTQRRIRDWYEHYDGDVYVSFSGGKDSTVLKHIVNGMYKDVPSLFINTGLEYPEIQKFAMSQSNVVTVRPKVSFLEVIKKYGYPVVSKAVAYDIDIARRKPNGDHYQKLFGLKMYQGKKSRFCNDKWSWLYDAPFKISQECCGVMKKRPAHQYTKETNRQPILATMASESALRNQVWLKYGCNAFEAKRPSSKPMSFWTEQDVLHYLVENKVPYCKKIYGDIVHKQEKDEIKGQISITDIIGYSADDQLETTGLNRTGCIFCMFGCHLEKEPNRFQRLKQTHPKQYAYCIGGGEFIDGMWMPNKDGLGLGFVLDYLGVKY